MYIDTGSATSNSSFDPLPSSSARLWNGGPPAAKSAPPSKSSFDDREHPQPHRAISPNHPAPPDEPSRQFTYSASQGTPISREHAGSQNPVRSNSTQEAARPYGREGGGRGARGGIDDRVGSSHNATNSPPTAGRSLLPEGSSSRQASGSARFVPQTATLPSPAYHTTSFMRQQHGGGPPQATPSASYPPRTSMPNPPQTARLPEHLRSPPSSKTQFLSLFASFYDSLGDSRTLKATLEDQVRRSNTLLQTLQRSSKVLEETVERKVREERTVWEERTRRLEERMKILEAEVGVPVSENQQAEGSGSGSRVGADGASTSAEGNATSQASNVTGTSTTTPGKRGGRTTSGKASSSTSSAGKGKGKAAAAKGTTRARTRKPSASVSTTGPDAEAEGDQDQDQDAETSTNKDVVEEGSVKGEEKDELMEE